MGFNGTRAQMMEEAINKLKFYYGVKSKEDFYLAAITGDKTGEETKEGSEALADPEAAANTFKGMTNLMDGGMIMKDILGSFQDLATSAKTDKEAQSMLDALRRSFVVVGGLKGTSTTEERKKEDPAGLIHDSIDLMNMLPQTGAKLNKGDNPTKAEPSIATIQVRPASLNISTRDSGAVDLFMNSIPTLEWSRAIPYFNMMVVNPGKSIKLEGKGVKGSPGSLTLFLIGDEDIAADHGADLAMAEAGYDFLAQDFGDKKISEFSSVTIDMSSFCAPQSLVDADNNYSSFDSVGAVQKDAPAMKLPVLDKMRPFMTVKSFSVNVSGTRGMMSTRSATLQFTLHDKSRLPEIAELIRPGTFGKNELLIEYGWSHPDGYSISSDSNDYSEYGRFLDTMKIKEKYGVSNSAYNFTDDGQVDITLNLVTKGAQVFNLNDIALDPTTQASWAALEEVISTIRTLSRKLFPGKGMEDVAGMSSIAKLSLTNAHEVLSGDSMKEIRKFQASLRMKKGTPRDVKDLSFAINKASQELVTHQTNLASAIKAKIDELDVGNDPFLMPRIRNDTYTARYDSKKYKGDGVDATMPMTPNPELRKELRTVYRNKGQHPSRISDYPNVYTADARQAQQQLETEEAEIQADNSASAESKALAHAAAKRLYQDLMALESAIRDNGPDHRALGEYVYWLSWESMSKSNQKEWSNTANDYIRSFRLGSKSDEDHTSQTMFGRLNEMKDSKIISSEARRKVASLRDYMTVPKKLSDSSSTEDYLAAAVALRTKTAKMLTFQANAQMNIDEDGSVQTKRHHTRKRFDSYAKARINHDYNQSFEVKGGGAKFDWKAYGPGSTDGYMAVDKYLTERFNTDPADSMASGALQGRSSSGTYTTNVDGEMKTIKMSGLDPYAGMGIQPGGFTKIKSAIIKRSDMSGASLEKIAKAEQTRARSRRKVKGKAFIDLYGEWQYASLGKIMTSFVAAPLASSGRFDEVQLYFYCFNDRSSWMWTQNMSSMPISIEKFRGRLKAWRKKRGNVSINSFLAFVNKAFVSSMDNSAYGFGGYYKWDEKNLTVKVKEKVNVAEMHADREKVLLGAYDTNGSGDQNLVFKRPSMAVYVEVVPARTRGNPEGLPSGEFTTICRVHVYDRSACKYTGAQQIATMASNTNLGIIKSGLLPLVKMKDDDLGGVNSMDAANHNMRYNAMIKAAMDLHLLKKESIKFEIPPDSELAKKGVTETKPQDVFTIQGGPEAIKYFIKSNMPNISLNSATSAVIKASAASQHNSKNATIHMIRMNKESKDQKTLPGTDELGLPMRMSPMSVSLDVFGCPLINFGQQFFIDFGTNTTIDDIYGVVGISHTITPGEFKTNVKFVKMESYGKYESLLQTLNKASLKLNQAQLIAPSNDTKDAT